MKPRLDSSENLKVYFSHQGLISFSDSAEKPYECFDAAQHERKVSNNFTRSSVRPEALEG